MSVGEKLATGLLALLLAAALAIPFLIDTVLGVVILVFALGTVGWIYGVRKQRVEEALRQVAAATDLELEPHAITYSVLRGRYHDRPSRVEIVGRTNFGVGAVATVTTGANLAAADIRNFTRIRMRPAGTPDETVVWAVEPVADEIVIDLPMVGARPDQIIAGLEQARVSCESRKQSEHDPAMTPTTAAGGPHDEESEQCNEGE